VLTVHPLAPAALPCRPVRPAALCVHPPHPHTQVIKGPVTKYLPVNARRIGFSVKAELQPMERFARESLDDGVPVVFVVGAFAHGAIDTSYVDEEVAVSQYPLSAAYALARITNAMEQKWGIV
jgi:rRNA small subunit pseudouridine methyltransferase Nep1